MRRRPSVLFVLVFVASCRQQSPPAIDTHGLVEEVHHKPEVARRIIAEVVTDSRGVALVAGELSKSEIAAGTVVDELMKQPAMAAAMADRCAAAAIATQVDNVGGANRSE